MQFFHPKRYRFFYPAGLISLVLLPILGILYLRSKPVFEQQFVMEVNFWTPNQFKEDQSILFNNSRKYNLVFLNGNEEIDQEKLKVVQLTIREFIEKKDTINGIHIEFGPKAKYGSMVQALNIFHIENARTYLTYKHHLWVFYKRPVEFFPICGGVYLINKEFQKPYSLFPLNFIETTKSFWPAGILYLIMVALTAQKVVRQIRRPNLNH